MFPVHIIRPFVEEGRRDNCPGFVQLGPFSNGGCPRRFWPFLERESRPCMNPEFDPESLHSPIANVLQKIHEAYQAKSEEEKKSKETTEKQDGKESQENATSSPKEANLLQPVVDLMKAFSTLDNPKGAKSVGKWKYTVDCRGFESRNIKVKIDAHELLVKAFKKEKFEDGLSTSSMRKKVALPENIDTKKITCKLSPNGTLVIEAPYLERENKESKKNPVKELMSVFLPGWEEFLEFHANNDETEKENSDKKSDGGNSGDNKKNESEAPAPELKPEVHEDKDEVSSIEQEKRSSGDEETCKVDESSNIGDEQRREKELDEALNEDDKQSSENHDDDGASISSEDSFILLSELEKGNSGSDKDSMKPSTSREDVQVTEEDEKTNESTEPDTIQKSQDLNTGMNHNIGDDNVNKQWEFRLEMPSYNPESIKINFEESKRVLNITASKENSAGTDFIVKSVQVGDDVDVSGLQCSFRDGSLSVKAPYNKAQREIPINF